jgi:hypothetical protein
MVSPDGTLSERSGRPLQSDFMSAVWVSPPETGLAGNRSFQTPPMLTGNPDAGIP